MSGFASFYRPRILLFANIPQIEEGAISGFLPLYSIAVQALTIPTFDNIVVSSPPDVQALLTSVDALQFDYAVPVDSIVVSAPPGATSP